MSGERVGACLAICGGHAMVSSDRLIRASGGLPVGIIGITVWCALSAAVVWMVLGSRTDEVPELARCRRVAAAWSLGTMLASTAILLGVDGLAPRLSTAAVLLVPASASVLALGVAWAVCVLKVSRRHTPG